MKRKTDYKYNKGQESVINIVSITVVSLAALIIVSNIAAGNQQNNGNNFENATEAEECTTPKEIAGLSPEQVKGEQGETDAKPVIQTSVADTSAQANEESVTQPPETSAPPATEPDTAAEATDIPSISSKEYNNVASGKLSETGYVKSDYFDNTLFLGDSRVVALANNGFINYQNTFAINGISHLKFLNQYFSDSITGVNGDIFTIVSVRQPKRIYVALGVNGVAYIEKKEFIKKYKELIDRLIAASPSSTIIIQSILPVNENNYTGGNENLNNWVIDDMNNELLGIAESRGVFYLDIAGVLKNGNNQLAGSYDSGDGLHFSFTGYSVVYDAICRHGVD